MTSETILRFPDNPDPPGDVYSCSHGSLRKKQFLLCESDFHSDFRCEHVKIMCGNWHSLRRPIGKRLVSVPRGQFLVVGARSAWAGI